MARLLKSIDACSVLQDWSLDELCGVCAILRIPFVVVVAPHLLRDKGKVRLRRIQFDAMIAGNAANANESFVSLDSLAATISSYLSADTTSVDHKDAVALQRTTQGTLGVDASSSSEMLSNLDCVLVDNDQYFESDRQLSRSDTPNWKSILKTLKNVSLRSESYLESLLRASSNNNSSARTKTTSVFAVQVSFWVLRDFGTCLMRRNGDASAFGASAEMTERYPKHKKVLKTLASAIDNVMKKNGFWNSREAARHSSSHLATILLYSKTDDRFDLVTLGDSGLSHDSSTHDTGKRSGGGRRDRRKGDER